jgi:hypothetical protein
MAPTGVPNAVRNRNPHATVSVFPLGLRRKQVNFPITGLFLKGAVMPLEVIGPGFARTGTKSLKDALEILGFGRCHHMYEVFDNPPQVAHWQALATGKPVDWATAFAGYRSQVDEPGAHVWQRLTEAFPDAKVVYTRRPEDIWVNSFTGTVAKLVRAFPEMELPSHISDMLTAMRQLLTGTTFRGNPEDPDVALEAYRRRETEVRAALSSERLLIFDVSDGWGPLCGFLGVEVPDQPFPHENQRGEFWKALGGEPD